MPDPGTTAAPDRRLLDALAGLIESALGRLIALDPAGPDLLARLDGRHLVLRLRGAARGLRLRVGDGRARPVPDDDTPADLALAVDPAGIAAWLGKGPARGLPTGLRIEGDLDLARLLERALTDFDPDWEQPFVALFGATLGPQLARGLGGALAFARAQARELAASGGEYLAEEARLVAARAQVEDFNAAVDTFRDDVERLAARVARLAREISGA